MDEEVGMEITPDSWKYCDRPTSESQSLDSSFENDSVFEAGPPVPIHKVATSLPRSKFLSTTDGSPASSLPDLIIESETVHGNLARNTMCDEDFLKKLHCLKRVGYFLSKRQWKKCRPKHAVATFCSFPDTKNFSIYCESCTKMYRQLTKEKGKRCASI